jgi:hypothetical protein
MKNYSILRIGNEYVVQADEKSVLKVASRRRAARTVNDAVELMDSKPQADPAGPSIVPPGIVPDPEMTLDPGIVPEPSKVP